jgi:alanine dehydrogenase
MLIGLPTEIKNNEYRAGLAPAPVRELLHHNHQVVVQTAAAAGLNVARGRITPKAVAEALGQIFLPVSELLKGA